MIRSMTGYGKAEATGTEGKFSVEIRAVNHRYGEVTVKLPRQMLALEGDIRRRVSERFKRGKIDLFIQFEPVTGRLICAGPWGVANMIFAGMHRSARRTDSTAPSSAEDS